MDNVKAQELKLAQIERLRGELDEVVSALTYLYGLERVLTHEEDENGVTLERLEGSLRNEISRIHALSDDEVLEEFSPRYED